MSRRSGIERNFGVTFFWFSGFLAFYLIYGGEMSGYLLADLKVIKMINAATNSKSGIPSRVIYDLGVKQSLLSYWIKTNLISPSIREGKRGNPKTSTALWSFNDLVEIQTILYLRKHGLSMQKVRKVLKWIRDNDYPLSATNLITDGQNVLINLNRKVIEILGDKDQYVLLEWKDMVKSCLNIYRKNAVKKEKS